MKWYNVRQLGRIRAMTLVELMVVLSIVGILSAIILPAVFSARRAARRSECSANLRQIGVAVQVYEGTYSVFPPAHGHFNRYGVSGIWYYSKSYAAHAMLLPYIERDSLYAQINFSSELSSPNMRGYSENSTAARTHIALYLCPADLGRAPLGSTNYRTSLGGEPRFIERLGLFGHPMDGVFTIYHPVRTGEVTDGLAHTIAISEKSRGDYNPSAFAHVSDVVWIPFETKKVTPFRAMCESLDSGQATHFSQVGASWMIADTRYTLYNHALTPNSVVGDCGYEISYPSIGAFAARSNHGGGMNCLFADGAVRWVSDSVDREVWISLGTRDGGEKVNGDAF